MADRARQAKTGGKGGGGAWKFSKGCARCLAATYHNCHNSTLVFRRRRGGGYDAQGVVVR